MAVAFEGDPMGAEGESSPLGNMLQGFTDYPKFEFTNMTHPKL